MRRVSFVWKLRSGGKPVVLATLPACGEAFKARRGCASAAGPQGAARNPAQIVRCAPDWWRLPRSSLDPSFVAARLCREQSQGGRRRRQGFARRGERIRPTGPEGRRRCRSSCPRRWWRRCRAVRDRGGSGPCRAREAVQLHKRLDVVRDRVRPRNGRGVRFRRGFRRRVGVLLYPRVRGPEPLTWFQRRGARRELRTRARAQGQALGTRGRGRYGPPSTEEG